MWIDSHAHLEDEAFDADRSAVLDRARAAGVELFLNAGSTPAANIRILAMLPGHDDLFAGLGLHPHEFPGIPEAALDDLPRQLSQEKVVAVGEIGLDYHVFRDMPAPDADAQQRAFRRQLRLARVFELPLLVHVREAYADALRILREEGPFNRGGVLHCYAGGPELVEEVLALGFSLGFGATVGYPKADEVRAALKRATPEKILLETDAPYLPPQSRRGGRNEPAFLAEIAQTAAQVKGLTLDELADVTRANTRRLFQLDPPAADVLAYPLGKHMYVNLTNRCSANCVFCPRRVSRRLQTYDLTLRREPSAREVIAALGDLSGSSEVVFCGFGEPVLRLPVLLAVAREVKRQGKKVRVNTNGQADLIFGRDILPECAGLVDEWSVSLNSGSPEQYARLVQPATGKDTWESVTRFIARAARTGFTVTSSAVELPEVDLQGLAELSRSLGARYRGRIPQRLGEPEN
ncbi:MAG: YchF/TatD family DNA exonuclease [Candidatus Firestonebacteria bacterium]|nr:YchF/TatD family DNA exonuclease [Candidatus Firestonebacteria bacterium]